MPLGEEEFLYKEGSLALELVNCESDNNLKVLVNGEEAAVFYSNQLNLAVKDGDVVEVDGSSASEECEVRIISGSENIATECTGCSVTVNSDIKKLIKVKMK